MYENPGARPFACPETFERFAAVPGAPQHVTFAFPNIEAALGQRLAATGVEPTPITALRPISNMLFRDNGLLPEATWPLQSDEYRRRKPEARNLIMILLAAFDLDGAVELFEEHDAGERVRQRYRAE